MSPTDLHSSLFSDVSDWLNDYQFGMRISECGRVLSIGDGIAWIGGLPTASMDDVLLFDDGSRGVVYELSKNMVGAVLLHETAKLTAGTVVHLSHRTVSVPVGDTLLGRVIDPLGVPLDDGPALQSKRWRALELSSPSIVARDFVHKPLYTGIKAIDTLIPIGKGQRQLLVGDEGMGRSAIAIDSVINQRGKDVFCIYVLIGQKRSTMVNTIGLLREQGAMEYTTVVAAEGSSLPGLQYLAPFVGCSIAEYWMYHGKDTLVVYDDLSTHAKTYRELSLLLRRPPGREAYPGDIFSVHARLLERATCLNAGNGGGSMTALPIVETQQGEIASYIPTNLISITDGQIYLDRELFVGGFRPAVDIGRSVSRIGGQAQHPCIKAEAGRMKLDYLQFLELEVFTRFGARLEASMEAAIEHGRLLREILKQERLATHSIEFQLAWLIAFNDGYLKELSVTEVAPALEKIHNYVESSSLNLESTREQWQAAVRACLHNNTEKAKL